jgi:hypothetical protein
MDMDLSVQASVFPTDPAISIKITVVTDMVMIPLTHIVMLRYHVQMPLPGWAVALRFARAGGGKGYY